MSDENYRTKQLKLRVWSRVAYNRLCDIKDPDLIGICDIESHRGRQNKALRLLGDIVKYIPAKSKGRQKDRAYRIRKFEESKTYAKKTDFCNTWKQFHDLIYCNYLSKDTLSLESIGYEDISHLPKEGMLHVYWNRDQYSEVKKEEEKRVYVYPKALLETRKRVMLKAIVEHHFQKNFTSKLERYLELPKESLKKEATYNFSVRNFSAYAANFSQNKLEGENGYIEECEHYLRYFKALRYKMLEMKKLIKKKGGYEYIIKEMRKDSIKQILKEAPLFIGYNPDDDPEKSYTSLRSERIIKKLACKFVLAHGSYFDYDILYADDTSVSHICGDKADNILHSDYNMFEPDPDELQFIAKTEKEQKDIHNETLRRL